jgi:hypothetical protein
MLQPYFKQKMSWHTLSTPSGEVFSAGSSVILWPTWELFDHTMYMYIHKQNLAITILSRGCKPRLPNVILYT